MSQLSEQFFKRFFNTEGNKPIVEKRKSSGGHTVSLDGRPVGGRTPAQIEEWIDELERGGWLEGWT